MGDQPKANYLKMLRESLELGDLESVKRAADSLDAAGGDPVLALSNFILNELPEGAQRALAHRALTHLDSSAAASVTQRLGEPSPNSSGDAIDVPPTQITAQSGSGKRWVIGALIALAVLWPAYSVYRFNHPSGSLPAPNPPKPLAVPRTPAEMLAALQQEAAAGRHAEALRLAHELTSLHAGTPEADKAAKQIPEFEAVISAAEEAERIRAAEASAKAEAQRLSDKWNYSVNEDPMTSRKSRYARIQSENTVNFDFPYQGSQKGTLVLRDHPSYGRDVIFSIERGQLLCQSYDDCQIRIRFDEGKPEKWNAVGPSDNSSTSIFIRNQARFVQKMRAANVVRLQVPVYQHGEPMFEFHVGGFDNDRYKK